MNAVVAQIKTVYYMLATNWFYLFDYYTTTNERGEDGMIIVIKSSAICWSCSWNNYNFHYIFVVLLRLSWRVADNVQFSGRKLSF